MVTASKQPGALTVRVRLYNSGDGLPRFDLLPGQAADLTLTWPWTGEPSGTLGVGGWQFGVTLES